MSTFDVSREGEYIVLLRCEGPFGLPSSRWTLTVQEAESAIKCLSNAVKSMKERERSKSYSSALTDRDGSAKAPEFSHSAEVKP